jgi:hypothetical protein
MNDLYNEYQSNAQLKPLIKQKIELNELIANKKIDIKTINDRLVKYTTINSYNNENKKIVDQVNILNYKNESNFIISLKAKDSI